MGARVIKVERPGEGEEMRRAFRPLDDDRDDQSTYFVRVNAGKLSVAIDLGRPEARGVVLDLARAADVGVENFLPGVAQRLGCDYPLLAPVRPRPLHRSLSGYGHAGPRSRQAAVAPLLHTA